MVEGYQISDTERVGKRPMWWTPKTRAQGFGKFEDVVWSTTDRCHGDLGAGRDFAVADGLGGLSVVAAACFGGTPLRTGPREPYSTEPGHALQRRSHLLEARGAPQAGQNEIGRHSNPILV